MVSNLSKLRFPVGIFRQCLIRVQEGKESQRQLRSFSHWSSWCLQNSGCSQCVSYESVSKTQSQPSEWNTCVKQRNDCAMKLNAVEEHRAQKKSIDVAGGSV